MSRLVPPPRSRVRHVVLGAILFLIGVAFVALIVVAARSAYPESAILPGLVAFFFLLWGAYVLVIAAVGPRRVSNGLDLVVGVHERHTVALTWDQWWGWAQVIVDGRVVGENLRMGGFSLSVSWDFEVGDAERHVVHLEKRRPLLVSFARPQPLLAWVDGVFIAESPAPFVPPQGYPSQQGHPQQQHYPMPPASVPPSGPNPQ